MNASHDRFIHHECYSAIHASEDGGTGRFDIIEDEYGFYVSSAEGCLLTRLDTYAECETESQRLVDKFDTDWASENQARMGSLIQGTG